MSRIARPSVTTKRRRSVCSRPLARTKQLPSEDRGDRHAEDKPAHLRIGEPKAVCEGDERVAPHRLDVGEVVQQAGVAAEAAEADRRPGKEGHCCGAEGRDGRRLEASSEEEPDDERPDEELRHDREPDDGSGERPAVAVAPRDRGGQHQKRRDRPEADRREHGDRDQRGRVAAPVGDAEKPQAGRNAGQHEHGVDGRGDREWHGRERDQQDGEERRIDEELVVDRR